MLSQPSILSQSKAVTISSSVVLSILDAVRPGEGINGSVGELVAPAPAVPEDIARVAVSDTVGQNSIASRMPMKSLIAMMWCIGSMMVFIVLVFRVRRVNYLLKGEAGVDTWLQDDIADLCERLTVRVPDCVVSGAIRSPFLWCLGRVRLVWPESVSHLEQREQVRPVLVHELAHLKRRDHWTAWVEILALIVWWWNPVFWFVRRQLRASAEMACDAWVVELLPDQRKAYAELLVEFGRRGRTSQLAFDAVEADTGSRCMFVRRLEMIMNEDSRTRLSKWTVCIAMLLGVLSLPTFAIENTAQPKVALAEAVVSGDPTPRQQVGVAESESSDASVDLAATTRQLADENPKRCRVEAALDKTEDDDSAGVSASLDELIKRIEGKYYGELDRRELRRAAIDAIMSKLDDKSTLLTRDEFEQMTISVDGDLVGVGIAIHLDSTTKMPVVTRPIRNSPCLAAGIRPNDVILSIDRDSTRGLSLIELVHKIRGRRGSAVTLGIQRVDEKLDVKVVRQRFETSVVNPWSIATDGQEDYWADSEGKIGYVHIPAFTKHTFSQLRKILVELSDEGLKGLVIDLRNCGGGLLTAAIEVVDMFIDEGIILSSESRSQNENVTFKAKKGGAYIDLPLVVLMNGNTASAGEIVAASLQDHHRAAMVGEQTFGKGTVQSLFRLPDGSALKLTTAAWLRPNGKQLLRHPGRDDWGVQPDAGLTVVLSKDVSKQLAEQRESRLNRESVATPVDDTQLKKAVALLKNE